MSTIGNKFQPGQKVECNGNKEARVLGYYSTAMVDVRLWAGARHVGDVCVPEWDITPIEEERVTASCAPEIAEFIDPTGALRKAGLLTVQS